MLEPALLLSAGVRLFFIVALHGDGYLERVVITFDFLPNILSEKRLASQQNSGFLLFTQVKNRAAAALLQHLLVFDAYQESMVLKFPRSNQSLSPNTFTQQVAHNLACAAS